MTPKALVAGSAAILASILIGMKLRAAVPPLEVVPEVDLGRYMGTWYEIAHLPNRFEKGCVASKANYKLLQNGSVMVINECRLNGFNGPLKKVRGIARGKCARSSSSPKHLD